MTEAIAIFTTMVLVILFRIGCQRPLTTGEGVGIGLMACVFWMLVSW